MLERSMEVEVLFYLQIPSPHARPTASSKLPCMFLPSQEDGQGVSNSVGLCNCKDSFSFNNPGCDSILRQTGGIWEAFLGLAH